MSLVENDLEECADDANALSDDERVERTAELAEELLTCERLEEAFTELDSGIIRPA